MKKTLLLLFILSLIVCLNACNKNTTALNYEKPEFSTDYDPDVDSWKQIDPGDSDVSITWFCDYLSGSENIEALIYQRTGVNVNFQSASTFDHKELNTMIAGDNLPDVISVNDTALRILLGEEGYCYPLNKLAEWYAPSMLKNVTEDHWYQYRGSDSNTYALSSNFYSDRDILEMEELGIEQYASRDIMVRKDYLDAYINYKKSQNSNFNPDKEITKPSGFLDMCLWVKEQYGYTISNPTVAFAPFNLTGDELSYSITCLYEMFGYAPETSDGNLNYLYSSNEFKEALNFMNTLYSSNLVSSQNFGWDTAKLGQEVLNGRPFAVIGGTQLIHFQQAAREIRNYDTTTHTLDDSYQYVTILLTNENGDTPLLSSYAGKGVYQTMITKNCKRPDRVIKVLDYLMSEQGQRECMYGSSENYEIVLKPGEINPKTGKASTYGVLNTTNVLKDQIPTFLTISAQSVGVRRTSPLINPCYVRMVSEEDNYIGIKHPVDWILYQNKVTYYGYTYNTADLDYPIGNITRKELNLYTREQSSIFELWASNIAGIIMAKDKDTFEKLYKQTLNEAKEMGSDHWYTISNQFFQEYKEYRGIEFAYPKNKTGYEAKEVKLRGLTESMKRPSYVYEEGKYE